MDRFARRVGVTLVCAALLGPAAACTDEPAPAEPTPSATPVPVQVWRRADLAPVDRFLAGTRAVYGLVHDDRELRLVALDAATGELVWERPASPGATNPNSPLRIRGSGDRIAYLRPDGKGPLFARIVLADVGTGADVAVSPPLLVRSAPWFCGDGRDVCAVAQADYRGVPTRHRLRADTGVTVPEADARSRDGTRVLAAPDAEHVLVELTDRAGTSMLGLLRDDVVRWQTPLAEVFPSGFDPGYGSGWELWRDEQVYVGTVIRPATRTRDGQHVSDMATTGATAALSLTDGSVRWKDAGWLLCQDSLSASSADTAQAPRVPVRCRYRGTRVWGEDPPASTFRGLSVTVEGFDPRTGDTTWSVPVGAAQSLTGATDEPAVAGQTQFLVLDGTGPLVIDVATGRSRVPDADESFWCRDRLYFAYREAFNPDQSNPYRRVGGLLATACDRSGRPAARPPDAAATRKTGTTVGQHTVVATTDGLVGYRIG